MYDLELIILTHRHKLSLSLSIVITGACRRSPERHWSSWIWSLQNNNQKIVGDGFADVVGENRLDMETSTNIENNRLAAPGRIDRQTAPLDCSSPILAPFFMLLPLALQFSPDLK
ncbi:hypothetical protein F2Q69_00042607 [Brassica cretica]|uniref:Uncharacterized protein n=1 Tax=Brassica cretica TaxID=69181 RepID=A0A8S9NHE8_BRACR|nr:hypothetical protein F2Q69_00042607 [Brassica cretica]